jgi:hypothetical protein
MDEQKINFVARALAEAAGISWQPEAETDPAMTAVYSRFRDQARLAIEALEQWRAKDSAPENVFAEPSLPQVVRTAPGNAIIQVGSDVFYRAPNDRRETLCSVETVKDGYAYIIPYSNPHIGWVKLDALRALPTKPCTGRK